MDIRIILQDGIYFLEGVALICSLIFIKKYFNTPAKLLPLYLAVVFFVEYQGDSIAFDQWLYNLLGIFELLIFSYIFYFTVKEKVSKVIIAVICSISILLLFIDAIYINSTFYTFLSTGFSFVSLGLSIMGFIFLLELAKTEKVIYQSRILLYWVVIGLLLFHLCSMPVTVLTNDLFKIGNVENILIIQSIAAIAMYGCFIIGFIWSRKEYNY